MTPCRTSSERLLAGVVVLLAGCTGTVPESVSGRTPQEMLILSTAAEQALKRYDARPWRGLRVAVDVSLLRSLDRGYVRSAFRAHLARSGCIVVDDIAAPEGAPRATPAGSEADRASGAQVVLEVRVAGLGINDHAYWLGIPPGIPLPLPPGAGQPAYVVTSGVGLGYERMDGWALVQVWARDARTGAFRGESPRLWGYSHDGLLDDIWPSRAEQAVAREPVDAGARE